MMMMVIKWEKGSWQIMKGQVGEGVKRLQHHEKANFSRVIKSTITFENGGKIIKWWGGGYSNGGTS